MLGCDSTGMHSREVKIASIFHSTYLGISKNIKFFVCFKYENYYIVLNAFLLINLMYTMITYFLLRNLIWSENLLFSRLLSKNLKIKIYRTIILPVVSYGCETWSLTLREERKLRVFENVAFRRIFGPRRDEVTG